MGLDDILHDDDELIKIAYRWINAYNYTKIEHIKDINFKEAYLGASISYNILIAKKRIMSIGAHPCFESSDAYEKYIDAETRFNLMTLYIISLGETGDIFAEPESEVFKVYLEYSNYLAKMWYNYFIKKPLTLPTDADYMKFIKERDYSGWAREPFFTNVYGAIAAFRDELDLDN